MRLLRNKWDVLKCGRMNYWKESVFVALLAVVVVVGLALRVTASQTDKGKSAQKITASGGKQTGAVKKCRGQKQHGRYAANSREIYPNSRTEQRGKTGGCSVYVFAGAEVLG